jgi:CubicO group peptidase (beta-lactamase class C family)
MMSVKTNVWVGAATCAFCACGSTNAADLKASQVAAIDRYVTAEIARERIPGAEVGIYRDGHAILKKGYGLANVELSVPVTPDTLMQSGSTGKQFVATAIMQLVEHGKIKPDDSITQYFPDAPASWKPIKIKNLLSHTSGLSEYESAERARPGGEFDLRMDFSEEELLHKIEQLPIDFAVGEQWSYRNTNYVLLGTVIHRVTGLPYGEYLHQKLFAPTGMSITRIISDRDIIPHRSSGYEIKGGKLHNQQWVSPTFNSTADGALYFNVVDLEKWDRALYGKDIIQPESLKIMWTPFVLNDGHANGEGYGFGWFVHEINGHRVIEHGGAWQGFTCGISRYVDDKLTVVVLTNLDSDHATPEGMVHVIAGLVEPKLLPEPTPTIADSRPQIASTVRAVILQTLESVDVSNYYAAYAASFYDEEAGHRFGPEQVAELRGNLGAKWLDTPLALLKRKPEGDGIFSTFRTGSAGNFRQVVALTNAEGKLKFLVVLPDPDNR